MAASSITSLAKQTDKIERRTCRVGGAGMNLNMFERHV